MHTENGPEENTPNTGHPMVQSWVTLILFTLLLTI